MSLEHRGLPLVAPVSPVVWVRRLVVAGLPLAIVTAVAMSLSDRVPSLLERGAYRLGVGPRIADGIGGVDPFVLAHVLGWSALAFASGLAVGRVRRLPALVAVLVGAGVAIEIAQQRYTAVRAFEEGDIVANAVGVGLGSLLAAVVLVVVGSRLST